MGRSGGGQNIRNIRVGRLFFNAKMAGWHEARVFEPPAPTRAGDCSPKTPLRSQPPLCETLSSPARPDRAADGSSTGRHTGYAYCTTSFGVRSYRHGRGIDIDKEMPVAGTAGGMLQQTSGAAQQASAKTRYLTSGCQADQIRDRSSETAVTGSPRKPGQRSLPPSEIPNDRLRTESLSRASSALP